MRFLAVLSALNVFFALGGTNDYYRGYGAQDDPHPRGPYTGNDDHHDESPFYGHFADNNIRQRDAFDTDYITGSYGMERDHDHVPPQYTDYPHGYHKYDGPEGYGYSADESEYKDVHQPTQQRLAPHSFEAPILPYQPGIIMTQGKKQSNGAVSTKQSLSTQNPTIFSRETTHTTKKTATITPKSSPNADENANTEAEVAITQTQLTGSTLQVAKPPSEVMIIPETTDIKNQTTSQVAKPPSEVVIIPETTDIKNQTTSQVAKPPSEVVIIPETTDIKNQTTSQVAKPPSEVMIIPETTDIKNQTTSQVAKPPSEVVIIPETTDINNQTTSQEAKPPPEALIIPELPVTGNQTTNQGAKPASEVTIIPQPPDISGLTTKNITKEMVTLSLETLATTPKSSPNANQTEITHTSETPITEQPDEDKDEIKTFFNTERSFSSQ